MICGSDRPSGPVYERRGVRDYSIGYKQPSGEWAFRLSYELNLAVDVGRKLGGSRLIVALALKTAYLCVRRSVEVRALTRDQIKPEGIFWTAAKRQMRQAQQQGLIEWSDELQAVIKEALAIPRSKLAGS
jgi:hypothetical protein